MSFVINCPVCLVRFFFFFFFSVFLFVCLAQSPSFSPDSPSAPVIPLPLLTGFGGGLIWGICLVFFLITVWLLFFDFFFFFFFLCLGTKIPCFLCYCLYLYPLPLYRLLIIHVFLVFSDPVSFVFSCCFCCSLGGCCFRSSPFATISLYWFPGSHLSQY